MLLTVALGGNALSRRGEPFDVSLQRARVKETVGALAELARVHRLVATHGNGPQVGALALQAENAGGAPQPLDVLGAETEGLIGYLIEQEISNALPGREVGTLLTRVEVSPDDVAFDRPTKPIGAVYGREEADRVARARGWTMIRDGEAWRRGVASPDPVRICELSVIRRLVDAGVIVVCAGGGGIPVVRTPGGGQKGVEAVIDKDLSTALLAEGIGADGLLLLTDAPAVELGWGTPSARRIHQASPEELRTMEFAAGSMGPKIEAACRFVERTGRWAAIGALEDALAIVAGKAGTRIAPARVMQAVT